MGFIFFFNSICLGIGLAMDAFSVSIANGLNDQTITRPKKILHSLTFGIFQAIMPIIGWACIHTIAKQFSLFTHFIPWIALILLLFIGIKMIVEGLKQNDDEITVSKVTLKLLLIQAVATSIDALSVGFTIAEYEFIDALVCALTICVVTFFICILGVNIGNKIGSKFSNKANIFGGIILVGIGLEIFITGLISLYA